MTLAFVFPGQGAQALGMGRDLADAYPAARAVFEEVDEALGESLSGLIWGEDEAALTLTANAQPALMATSLAAVRALEAEGVGVERAAYVAGHSLGEYSALAAAGSLTVADAARLLRRRGEAMQAAVPAGEGAMVALVGVDFEVAGRIATEAAEGQVVQIANDNDPAQTVLSGARGAVERAAAMAKEHGAKRAIMLPVSAPFHCSLMAPAARVMADALDDVDIETPRPPLVANVLASGVDDPTLIRSLLVDQVTGLVRWRGSVTWMARRGVTEMWEIGAGRALSGMARRIDKSLATRQVGTAGEVRAAAGSL